VLPPARPGSQGRRPVMEMLGVRGSEIAGVLAERRLLGQPGKALDLVLFRGSPASVWPGHEQQQREQRRPRGTDHLRKEVAVRGVYQLPRSPALPGRGPWRGAGAPGRGEPLTCLRSHRLSLLRRPPTPELGDPFQPWSPHLCFPASLLARRHQKPGSHVYSESHGFRRHVTVVILPPLWATRAGTVNCLVKVRGPRGASSVCQRSDDLGVDGRAPSLRGTCSGRNA
jgi:hypothetical protein